MIQLVSDVAEKEIIGKVPPDTSQVEMPKSVTSQDLSIILISGSSDLPKFTAAKECARCKKAVASIKLKGSAKLLTVDMEVLNVRFILFDEILLSRMLRFVSSRVPQTRQDLQVGSHWN